MSPWSHRLAVGFSNLAHTLTHYSMLIYPTVVLALEKEFGLSYGELISLSLAGFVLYGAAALPAGWLADRWSGQGMMVVFYFGLGGSCLMAGLATSPVELGFAVAAMGLFASIYHPVGMAMLVRHAVSRGRALGINGIFGGTGVALAPVGTAFLMDAAGWQNAYLLPGAFILTFGCLLALAVALGWIREGEAVPAAAQEAPPQRREMVRAGMVLLATMLLLGLVYRVTAVALPKIFAVRMPDISQEGALGIGGLVTVVFLVQGVAQYVGGVLCDKFSPQLIYRLSFLFQAPVLIVAAYAFDLPLFFVAVVMIFVNIIGFPAENTLIARYAPEKWRATAYGAKFVVSLGVASLGVLLVAFIHEATGEFFWLFVAMAAASLTGFAMSWLLPSDDAMEAPAESASGGNLAAIAPGKGP